MKWSGKHTRILALKQKGFLDTEIAKAVGLSATRIGKITQDEEFKKRYEEVEKAVVKKIVKEAGEEIDYVAKARVLLQRNIVRAAKTMVKLSRDAKPQDRLKMDACKDILDRCGMKPVDVIETRERVYSTEEIEHAKITLQEVEGIMGRLGTDGSKFVIARRSTSSITGTNTGADSKPDIIETSKDRPSPLPA